MKEDEKLDWVISKSKNDEKMLHSSDLVSSIKVVNNDYVQKEWDHYTGFINIMLNDYIKSMNVFSIDENTSFYRGRPGEHNTIEAVKAPPADKAIAGRLNPAGLPMLYLASDVETCCYEVHRDPGTLITIGKFAPTKRMTLLDLTSDESLEKNANNFREIISENFSKPVTLSDKIFDYLPTQLISIYVKEHLQYDGVKYPSSLTSTGYNLVIFDVEGFTVELVEGNFTAK